MVQHIYLSPHLDDAVFSCGGLIFQQTQQGDEVLILTICAGEPPPGELSELAQELHERWDEAESPVQTRRREDEEACRRLGATLTHIGIPDAIYRVDDQGKHLYTNVEMIFGPVESVEAVLIENTADLISDALQPDARLYVPLCFGGHVDHRLTRLAAERLGVQLCYYRDLPYAARGRHIPQQFALPEGKSDIHKLELIEIETWVNAMMDYRSQISTFWPNKESVIAEIGSFLQEWGGIPILRTDPSN